IVAGAAPEDAAVEIPVGMLCESSTRKCTRHRSADTSEVKQLGIGTARGDAEQGTKLAGAAPGIHAIEISIRRGQQSGIRQFAIGNAVDVESMQHRDLSGERHLEDFAVVVGSARGGGSVQVSIWSLDETTDGITAVGAIEIVNDLDGASWRRHAKNDALAIGSTTGSAIEIAVRGQQQRRTHTCGRIQLQLLVGSGGNGDGVSCARIGDAVQIAVFPLYGRAFGNSFTFRETVQHSDRA